MRLTKRTDPVKWKLGISECEDGSDLEIGRNLIPSNIVSDPVPLVKRARKRINDKWNK